MKNYGNDEKTALAAKEDAQRISFAPLMFQAARALRDLGILKYLLKENRACSIEDIVNATDNTTYGVTVLLAARIRERSAERVCVALSGPIRIRDVPLGRVTSSSPRWMATVA